VTDSEKLKANEKILDQIKIELVVLRNPRRPLARKYLSMFPGVPADEVRAKIIQAREADVASYEHIIKSYRERLGDQG